MKLMQPFRWLVLGLVGVLVFIWPIPYTISAREILLLLLTSTTLYLVISRQVVLELARDLRSTVYLCAALTLWMIAVAVFLSNETAWCLSELQGQWGMGLLNLAFGFVIGTWMQKNKRWQVLLLAVIFVVLFTHVLYLDVGGIRQYFHAGELPQKIFGLAGGRDRDSLGVWLAGSFLLAEIGVRLSAKKKFLPISNLALVALAAATFLGSYVADSRNGMVVLLMLVVLTAAMHILAIPIELRRRLVMLSVGTIVLAPLMIVVLAQADDRWDTFFQTIPIALDTKSNRSWLEADVPAPKLANGQPVDMSNYLRIAWFKEAIVLTLERPLGRGYGRQIFGHALKEKYGVTKTQTHPHSGLLTVAVGAGVPGVLLWLGFCIALMRFGYRRFVASRTYPPLALFLLTGGFLLATTLDSMLQDHMLQEFMFFVGVLTALSSGVSAKTFDGAWQTNR